MLVAQVLGGFSLSDRSGRDVSPRSAKACCLIAYLAISGVTRERRERLAGILWSESGSKQAFDSLRHCIAEIRRAEARAEIPFLRADRLNVELVADCLETDRSLLSRALAERDMAVCRKLLVRPDLTLLAGIEAGDAAFDNWLVVERERSAAALVQEMLAALRDPAVAPRDRDLLTAAIERLDPYQEEAIRLHMEASGANGNVAAAIAAYERYRTRLKREFDVEPSDMLAALYDDLLAKRKSGGRAVDKPVVPPRTAAAAPPPQALAQPAANFQAAQRTPTIVMVDGRLPESAGLRQLAEGFRRELMTTLCRFKEWSVFAYSEESGEEVSSLKELIAQCARQAIDYALILSVSTGAGATTIHSQLVECESSAVLISDQYPAAPENWTAVVNDICCRIASRAQLTIAAARLRRVSQSAARRNAYDLWLEGETLSWLWTPENEVRAAELFEQAITIDGNLACAYGSWAAVMNSRWILQPGLVETPAERAQALALAKRAVALDPMDCRNHMHLGWCHLLARRFDPGELHFQLAYELNPSNPDNLLACGLADAYCGHHARARERYERAFSLNPFRPSIYWGYRASIALLGRDFDECVKAVANAPDIFPDIQGWAAVAHVHRGDEGAAEAAIAQFYDDVRQHWQGPPMPNEEMLRRWFVDVFPIRQVEDRKLLADGMASFGVAQPAAERPARATLRLDAR